MRHVLRPAFVLGSVLAFVIEAACSESLPSHDDLSHDDGGSIARPADAQTRESGFTTPISTMRIAHVARGLGPIDFCYQGARTGTFVGPVMTPRNDLDAQFDAGSEASAEAGYEVPSNTDRIAYATVSKYVELESAGPVTLAIVPAGASSCGDPLTTANVTLDPGKLSTVVLFGDHPDDDGGVQLEVTAFTDDRKRLPDKLRARVIHAAGIGPIAVRAVTSTTTILADRIEPRKAATTSEAVAVDALGYVTAAPIPPPTSIAIGPAYTRSADGGFEHWQSKPADLELRGGSLHTAFVLTHADGFEVLWCADTTTAGDQTACKRVR